MQILIRPSFFPSFFLSKFVTRYTRYKKTSVIYRFGGASRIGGEEKKWRDGDDAFPLFSLSLFLSVFLRMAPKKIEEPERKPLIGRVGTNLKVGIVGIPNVGKSTFFNVLTKSQAAAENFPFCTIDPNENKYPILSLYPLACLYIYIYIQW